MWLFSATSACFAGCQLLWVFSTLHLFRDFSPWVSMVFAFCEPPTLPFGKDGAPWPQTACGGNSCSVASYKRIRSLPLPLRFTQGQDDSPFLRLHIRYCCFAAEAMARVP